MSFTLVSLPRFANGNSESAILLNAVGALGRVFGLGSRLLLGHPTNDQQKVQFEEQAKQQNRLDKSGMSIGGLATGGACIRQEGTVKGDIVDQPVEWGYDGPGGPEHWATLAEEYSACADGKQQSPIDIIKYDEGEVESISFSYSGDARAVCNDGRFVHVEYGAGNTLSLGQRTYVLASAHFHSPSEHRINGASFAAELHLVHADADGNLAVVGLLFELGAPSLVVQRVLDAAPGAGETVVDGFTLNARDYVPGELDYYRYDGSKTTPPCDEPVDWYVMRQPNTVSPEQIDSLLELSGGPNNRPVQPTGDRVITTQRRSQIPGRFPRPQATASEL